MMPYLPAALVRVPAQLVFQWWLGRLKGKLLDNDWFLTCKYKLAIADNATNHKISLNVQLHV
jgi:hypothetical protein